MGAWIELFGALRKGAVLANAATWKSRQVLANAVVGLLVSGYAIARARGWIAIEVEHAALVDLGTGLGAALFAAYNIIATVATSDKVGLPGWKVDGAALVHPTPVPPVGGGLRVPARPAAAGPVPPDARRDGPRAPSAPPNPFLDD